MAKKLPLILSTLTLATCSFTSVWADEPTHSLEGPWSFEEMMAVENEVQPLIDETCPYEYYRSRCIYRYTDDRIKTDPIYSRLLAFEGAQFHILTMEPDAKNNKTKIEYYFNPENSKEKYESRVISEYDPITGDFIGMHFDKDSYTHTISKLYIYQTEEGYADAPVDKDDFLAMFRESYTRLLYYGEKTAEEESLLPLNQKGTLEINEVSYDPIYKMRINYAFEDETGKIHSHSTMITDCHQGGDTCKMQYNLKSPFPSLVNKPTYEEGYAAGFNDGYGEGNTAGYNTGYNNGEEAGHSSGYTAGRTDGYEEGHATGKQEGYNAGYEDGYQDGLARGEDIGFNQGFFEGQNIGYNEGFNDGQNLGQNEGYNEGFTNGFNEGYDEGYNEGFSAGQTDRSDNDIDNREGQTIPNDQINQSAQPEQTVQASQTEPTLAVATTTPITTKTTPNTGYPTQENTTSTEFPWWLGVIIVSGIAAIIWFFLPSRKN